jgi:hypothetical protein
MLFVSALPAAKPTVIAITMALGSSELEGLPVPPQR